MADKKARPQRSTGFNGEGGASPTVNAGKQLQYSWSLGGGDTVEPQPNPSGATPKPFWTGSEGTSPPNANPAAMRGYTRNAPYMEGLVSDPQVMFNEIMSLNAAVREDPSDVVSEYRLRVLKQALRDIYNLQTEQPYHREYRPSSALPVTPGSK